MKIFSTFLSSFMFVLLMTATAFAGGKVLVVHSYHTGYDWVDSMDEAIKGVLDEAGAEHKSFYMDTKRKSSANWKKESGELAKKMIAEYSPDVVIAVDDNAQAFVVKEYAGKTGPQFVFSGVNADPEKYGFPASNVTGILERTYADQGLELLAQILPDVKNVAYIADDSNTATLITPRSEAADASGALPVDIVAFHRLSFFSELKEIIAQYNANDSVGALIIPLYHTYKEVAGGDSITPSNVMEWVVKNSTKPVIGYWPFSTKDGALCAVVVDPKEHGVISANMAVEILGGKKAGDIPIATNKEGFVILNMKTAAKLSIEIPFEIVEGANKIIE